MSETIQFVADWLAFMDEVPAILGDAYYQRQVAQRDAQRDTLIRRAKAIVAHHSTPAPDTGDTAALDSLIDHYRDCLRAPVSDPLAWMAEDTRHAIHAHVAAMIAKKV